jgi:DNA phosphorothioation-associated putative methyltransferase
MPGLSRPRRDLVDFFVARGRPPLVEELPQGEQMTAVFGSIKRAFGAIRRTNGEVPWEAIAAQRREDLSLHLALSRFERGIRWSKFGEATQADIRALYGTYASASRAAETLLLSIGQTDALDEAFAAASIGKITQTALYVHRDNIDQLPVLLRLRGMRARIFRRGRGGQPGQDLPPRTQGFVFELSRLRSGRAPTAVLLV